MEPNFKRKVLDNGMTILFEKRDLPVVSVAFAVRNGGVNESLEEKGISHFIEHMLYKGTEKRNWKQVASEIEKNGGVLNGFTSEEMTGYYCKMPSGKLDIALDVLSDIVKNPKFDEKELEKERKVIFEEIKMRKDRPNIHVFDEIQKRLYDGVFDIDLIGTYETMGSIDRKQILEKFNQVYKPNNMIMCVVGDCDFDKIVNFAEDNFGKEKGEVPEQKFGLKNEEKIEKRKDVEQANIIFAYHVPFASEKGNYTAKVLSALMAEGLSSRLLLEIREKRNLAYAVHGGSEIGKRFAYNFIYVGTMKENVEEVRELVLEEFKKVSKELDEKELNEIKEQLVGQYQISMEDSQDQMISLISYEIHGDAGEFYNFEKEIKKVKLEDVKEMASKVKKDNYSFFALLPE
jgi:predicted Zn-dependent peptidase